MVLRTRVAAFCALVVSVALGVVGAAAVTADRAAAALTTLYAVTGDGQTASALYTVNPGSGATTSVANVTLNGSQVNGINGLAFDPTDGKLYAFKNGGNCCSGTRTGTLYEVDKA